MYVLICTGTNQFFAGIKTVQGQPMAVACDTVAAAKKFRSIAAAEQFKKKWDGAGVGMKRFDGATQ